VTNWSSYDRSLVKRGDITLWLSDDEVQSWNHCPKQAIGRPRLYSDLAIETALSLRLIFKLLSLIFKLPRRQTEGFLRSLLTLLRLDLSVPDHGYYHQSKVENMLYRYKTLLGDQLRARGETSRQVESVLACNILNHFRSLGRPQCDLVT
jgi:hypothetical protein